MLLLAFEFWATFSICFFKRHQVAVGLSDDHNPDTPGELERIESCGGFVSPPPEEGLSARVWLDKEMTRIGLVSLQDAGTPDTWWYSRPLLILTVYVQHYHACVNVLHNICKRKADNSKQDTLL